MTIVPQLDGLVKRMETSGLMNASMRPTLARGASNLQSTVRQNALNSLPSAQHAAHKPPKPASSVGSGMPAHSTLPRVMSTMQVCRSLTTLLMRAVTVSICCLSHECQ